MTAARAAAAVEAGEIVLVECRQLLAKLSNEELVRSIKVVSSETLSHYPAEPLKSHHVAV